MSEKVILNFNGTDDPFSESKKGNDSGNQSGVIHIRIQQRNGRKTLTTVQGISDSYDKKKLAKACKKFRHHDVLRREMRLQEFACNGTVVDHPEYGEVLQLQGDQRHHVAEFLINIGLASKEQVKIHGF